MCFITLICNCVYCIVLFLSEILYSISPTLITTFIKANFNDVIGIDQKMNPFSTFSPHLSVFLY